MIYALVFASMFAGFSATQPDLFWFGLASCGAAGILTAKLRVQQRVNKVISNGDTSEEA